jgi:hypothetical protein
MKIFIIIIALVFSYSSHSKETEQWICAADKASGYLYIPNKNKWVSTEYNITRTFIIRTLSHKALKEYPYQVNAMGENDPMFICKDMPNVVYCSPIERDGGTSIRFNKKTGRYIRSNLIGFVEEIDDNTMFNSPTLELGKCSAF